MQNNKQILSSLTRRNLDKKIEPYRIPDASSKLNAKWSQEEQLLGVQGSFYVLYIINGYHLRIFQQLPHQMVAELSGK